MSAPVAAQTAVGESVEGRARPEYDPLGIQLDDALRVIGRAAVARRAGPVPRNAETLGSFTVNTTTELETVYDDNIFRTATGERADFIAKFRPQIKVASDWANHGLNLTLGGEIGRHADLGSEDYADFAAALGGKVDVDEGESVDLNANWGRSHEARGSIDDTGSPKPTTFQTYGFSGVYNRDAGEIFSRTTLSAVRTDYFDNGATNNDDRDLWTYTLRQRFGHDVDEGSQIFVEGTANLRDFTASINDNGEELGSHGFEVLAGLVWDVSGVTFVEFGVGYFIQDYNEATFPNSTGPSFRGRAVWNPTGLVTLSGNAAREVKDTAQAGVSGIVNSTFSLRLDWEALYNLILSTDARLVQEKSKGTSREDETKSFSLGARWLIGQNWSLRGTLAYDQKDSTSATSDYTDTRFMITLIEKL